MPRSFQRKDILGYALLAFPLAFAGIPIYIHAPDFYVTEYEVSLSALGLVLLGLRIFDAVQDPLIGYFSDKFAKYRLIFMPLAALTLLVGFGLLFNPIVDSYLFWFALCIIVATSAFSILTINLNSIGGMWSKDKHEKTTIASYREAFGLLGLILAVILPSILQNHISKQQSFYYLSMLLSVTMVIAMCIFIKWYKAGDNNNIVKISKTIHVKQFTKISSKLRRFFIMYAVSILASSMPSVLVLFFIRDRLGLESYIGLFLLAYFVSGAVGISIWNKLSFNIGKNQTWLISMMLAVASFVWAYFLSLNDFWPYLVICIVSGIAFGAELVLPTSILADYIHSDSQEESASLYYGILAFLMKISLALSAAIVFPYLEYWGFKAGKENTEQALQSLSVCYAVIPCALKIISIILLRRIVSEESNPDFNRSNDYV